MLPREEWISFIPGAHPGYITLDQYDANRAQLAANAAAHGRDRAAGPPREGPALLQGIIICGTCGLRMTVRYHQRHDQQVPTYVCQRDGISHGRRICQADPRRRPRPAASGSCSSTPSPRWPSKPPSPSRPNSSTAPTEADALRAAHVERARYHADLARRRYLAVDPANRLVAGTLEADWNTALRALSQAQDTCEQARKHDTGQLTDAQKTRIRQLVTDLPAIWNDPATPARERKRIARLLLTDVTVTRTRDTITAHVRLPAGQHHTLTLPIPPNAAQLRKTPAAVVTAVDELLDHHTHAQIAGILNDRGLTSGEGRPFHRLIIRNIRDDYGLRSREQRLRDAGMLTLTQMAGRLGVPAKTVKIWHHAGLITGHPYNDKGECLYPPPGPNPPTRAQGRKLSERRPARRPQTTREPAGNVGPHRYRLHHDNNTTARIDPKRCSMQPEVSIPGPRPRSSPAGTSNASRSERSPRSAPPCLRPRRLSGSPSGPRGPPSAPRPVPRSTPPASPVSSRTARHRRTARTGTGTRPAPRRTRAAGRCCPSRSPGPHPAATPPGAGPGESRRHALRLRDQPPEIPRRPGIPRGLRRRQQPLRRDPPLRRSDPVRDQLSDQIIIAARAPHGLAFCRPPPHVR